MGDTRKDKVHISPSLHLLIICFLVVIHSHRDDRHHKLRHITRSIPQIQVVVRPSRTTIARSDANLKKREQTFSW